MAQQQTKAAAAAPPDDAVAPVAPTTTGPAQKTFPQIMGQIVTMVLADRTLMPQAKREFEIWYNAQPIDGRSALAKQFKLEFEYTKGIVESTFHHFMSVAYMDFQ